MDLGLKEISLFCHMQYYLQIEILNGFIIPTCKCCLNCISSQMNNRFSTENSLFKSMDFYKTFEISNISVLYLSKHGEKKTKLDKMKHE